MHKYTLILIALSFLNTFCFGNPGAYIPEEGSPELSPISKKQIKQLEQMKEHNPELPLVLIIGDSISVGYTKPLIEIFSGKANIIHNAGNAQGTTYTLENIDSWLAVHDWDVIHFNNGLHDLKRVTIAGTAQNSNDPNDPRQADIKTYSANMKKIVKKLKATNAKLIFATTTPFPNGVKPHRDPEDAAKYNSAAIKLMKKHHIKVNDLYSFILPKLEDTQKPVNVHFTEEGSEALANEVARYINEALAD